jgi:hypothetical protein
VRAEMPQSGRAMGIPGEDGNKVQNYERIAFLVEFSPLNSIGEAAVSKDHRKGQSVWTSRSRVPGREEMSHCDVRTDRTRREESMIGERSPMWPINHGTLAACDLASQWPSRPNQRELTMTGS